MPFDERRQPSTTMSAVSPLSALPSGEQAQVHRVGLPGALGDRLVELGLTSGALVRVLRRAPFGGPLQVQVRDYVLSLRRQEAADILVQRLPA
jgi:ferrous iron transport protein A